MVNIAISGRKEEEREKNILRRPGKRKGRNRSTWF